MRAQSLDALLLVDSVGQAQRAEEAMKLLESFRAGPSDDLTDDT